MCLSGDDRLFSIFSISSLNISGESGKYAKHTLQKASYLSSISVLLLHSGHVCGNESRESKTCWSLCFPRVSPMGTYSPHIAHLTHGPRSSSYICSGNRSFSFLIFSFTLVLVLFGKTWMAPCGCLRVFVANDIFVFVAHICLCVFYTLCRSAYGWHGTFFEQVVCAPSLSFL